MTDSLEQMVREQIEARGVRDERVLAAMRRVDRALFVGAQERIFAYEDTPLPLSEGQSISQPFIVAYMTELLGLAPQHRVLEIGTGCGYQSAILGELVDDVRTLELRPGLAAAARARLEALGYHRIRCSFGDGYQGFAAEAPFDAILLTAAPPSVPAALLEQLAMNGRLVAPVGETQQQIVRLTRTPQGITREWLLAVRFVPMVPASERG